jgi:hypothetical protein
VVSWNEAAAVKLLLFFQRGNEDENLLTIGGCEVGELFELLDVSDGVFSYILDDFSVSGAIGFLSRADNHVVRYVGTVEEA